jgi:hypothetical protein
MTGMTSEREELLTIEEVLAVLRVSRTAFGRWRRQGTGPTIIRQPGGSVRIRRSARGWWLHTSPHPDGKALAARDVVTGRRQGVKPGSRGRLARGCERELKAVWAPERQDGAHDRYRPGPGVRDPGPARRRVPRPVSDAAG